MTVTREIIQVGHIYVDLEEFDEGDDEEYSAARMSVYRQIDEDSVDWESDAVKTLSDLFIEDIDETIDWRSGTAEEFLDDKFGKNENK